MAVIGSEKQEKKIAELSQIAQEHYPGHQSMSFKGAFRMGAQKAVQKSGFNSWDEVAQQPAAVRRKFFNTLLQESRPHLVKITGEGNVDQLLQKQFLHSHLFRPEPAAGTLPPAPCACPGVTPALRAAPAGLCC